MLTGIEYLTDSDEITVAVGVFFKWARGRVGACVGTVAITMLLFAISLSGQTGQISGLVGDEDDVAFPDVTVEVSSRILTEKFRTTATDAKGRYQFSALPPGTYEVMFHACGYQSQVRPLVVVKDGVTADVSVNMRRGHHCDSGQ